MIICDIDTSTNFTVYWIAAQLVKYYRLSNLWDWLHTLLACSMSRKGSNQNHQGCCNLSDCLFLYRHNPKYCVIKIDNFVFKGKRAFYISYFHQAVWNIRFSWDTNIMRMVVCVRARYRSFLLTGAINFYESLNMHIAHNTTACAQNKYTHRHIESLSQIKL